MIEKCSKLIITFSEKYLPSPITITVILTFLVFGISLLFTESHFMESISYWNKGFWELLAFTMQMSLILIFGHALASTKIASSIILSITRKCESNETAVVWVSISALIASFLNWGLGLVFGAILARKVAENAQKKGIDLNYPLIGAAAYSGLIIWHGGFSGSAPLTVASENHFLENALGIISISETTLSWQNLIVSCSLLVLIPYSLKFISKKISFKPLSNYDLAIDPIQKNNDTNPNDKLNSSPHLVYVLGALLLLTLLSLILSSKSTFSFINLNFINLLCLTLGLILHKSLKSYGEAVEEAIKGISGILLLFPFYAGIMGIMKYSGLASLLSEQIASIATENTFPMLTFLSSGIVNLFVPSGGGQWAVQGEVLSETVKTLGLSKTQMIMAFSYGDELTNMLQPFWALPLLGITKLKAKEIIPYTFFIMLVSIPIFLIGIYLF